MAAQREKKGRCSQHFGRASIPGLRACEARALPTELPKQMLSGSNYGYPYVSHIPRTSRLLLRLQRTAFGPLSPPRPRRNPGRVHRHPPLPSPAGCHARNGTVSLSARIPLCAGRAHHCPESARTAPSREPRSEGSGKKRRLSAKKEDAPNTSAGRRSRDFARVKRALYQLSYRSRWKQGKNMTFQTYRHAMSELPRAVVDPLFV